MNRRAISSVFLLASFVALAACGGGEDSKEASSTTKPGSGSSLEAQTASFDLAVGPADRYLIGLFTGDQRGVAYGDVELKFCFLGATKATEPCRLGEPHTASFLATPGTPVPPDKTAPEIVSPAGAKGVYATRVGFDRAGIWEVHVSGDIGGQRKETRTSFPVLERHAVPAVGDAGIPVENLTVTTPGAPPAAVDSRASAGGLVPNPEIHKTTIAAAMAAHRPVVAVFATPVYCVSRFCGPITDMVASLEKTYGDRASFVHVEIWRDRQKNEVNKAAADWLYRNDNMSEPWVFLVGADGKVAGRWDNVATQTEIEPQLQKLPVIGRA